MASKSKTSAGKIFEECWKESYKDLPIYYLRLHDAAKWNRGSESSFTPSNPYDSLQFKIPFLWLLELKSTKDSSVSFNPHKPYEKPTGEKTQVMIKYTQVKALMEAAKKDGVIAGLIINFRERILKTKSEPNEVFFIHINEFIKFAEETGKSTLNRQDCAEIGVPVYSVKKKVNYTYLINNFIEHSVWHCLNKGYINKEKLKDTYNWIGRLLKSDVEGVK